MISGAGSPDPRSREIALIDAAVSPSPARTPKGDAYTQPRIADLPTTDRMSRFAAPPLPANVSKHVEHLLVAHLDVAVMGPGALMPAVQVMPADEVVAVRCLRRGRCQGQCKCDASRRQAQSADRFVSRHSPTLHPADAAQRERTVLASGRPAADRVLARSRAQPHSAPRRRDGVCFTQRTRAEAHEDKRCYVG